jgi:hypothetical protein
LARCDSDAKSDAEPGRFLKGRSYGLPPPTYEDIQYSLPAYNGDLSTLYYPGPRVIGASNVRIDAPYPYPESLAAPVPPPGPVIHHALHRHVARPAPVVHHPAPVIHHEPVHVAPKYAHPPPVVHHEVVHHAPVRPLPPPIHHEAIHYSEPVPAVVPHHHPEPAVVHHHHAEPAHFEEIHLPPAVHHHEVVHHPAPVLFREDVPELIQPVPVNREVRPLPAPIPAVPVPAPAAVVQHEVHHHDDLLAGVSIRRESHSEHGPGHRLVDVVHDQHGLDHTSHHRDHHHTDALSGRVVDHSEHLHRDHFTGGHTHEVHHREHQPGHVVAHPVPEGPREVVLAVRHGVSRRPAPHSKIVYNKRIKYPVARPVIGYGASPY